MKNQTSLQHKSSPGQSIAPALGASLVERGGSCGGGDAGGAPRPTSALQHERRPAHEPVIIGDSISCTSQGFIMNLPRLQFVRLAASAAALPVAARLAWAQTYPTRPVRMIVPFAPGGPTDIVARLLTQKLGEHLGRQFYVENVAGAGGNLGMRAAARAAPDGYTLALVSSSYMVNPSLYPKVPYDQAKDFVRSLFPPTRRTCCSRVRRCRSRTSRSSPISCRRTRAS
jgi:hypothetical protein